MTTFEAGMWISGILFVSSLFFAGLGAFFHEKKLSEGANASYMIAGAMIGMSLLSAGKSLLSLIIN